MITKDNLPAVLTALGFSKKGAVFHKAVNGSMLEVNTLKGEIIYPEAQGLVINERQTCNFSSSENFVVLECVHRLLMKGYKPAHIELEPKWKVGHGASGGRADILVKDNNGKPLLLIECKTVGNEFKKAWNKTLLDGDQLFSYAQQISETQFLCLYTSDFEGGSVTYTSNIIAHRDNEKYLADNPLFKSFNDASDVKERFAVWRDTYKQDFTTKGVFEDNIQSYHIGKDKYSLADLHGISASDQQKKYHEFATILRQHNVSGRENAFDKLVNLFLCKLVDETENPNELKFYWKGVAYDTHFEFLDRLQQLYQAGMGKFLGEDITYINQNDVSNALRFIRQNPDATQRAVWNLFIQQKFFTNNDFSLIDVHNEKLFYQNADVLLKILQMWQDIRLTGNQGNHQFLGDMFEGFLDQGVKQSEGQYFTPMPICRFILMSLPLEHLVKNSAAPPLAIDYACGSGHFLNELALQIKPVVEKLKPNADLASYHKAIYGIEKEYRLSKVAKVSAFMYGQQDINICYGDALKNQHSAFPKIQDGSFDLLVANPPYSVRGFLETLHEDERKAYELTQTINDFETANSIETFFIERTKQLLKAGGVAALILPSSILSNGNSTYIKTREILLQYFDFVAIAEFGSGTFGKTGTNTVTLFLRRKKIKPDTAEHYRERIEQWFTGCGNDKRKQVIYKDEHLIKQYAAHISVPLADYKTLLQGDAQGVWCSADYFDDYTKKFNASTEIRGLYNQRAFLAKSEAEQTAEIDKRYLDYVQTIERDKLYYYCLASDQTNPVLIIRSPSETRAIKQFLGYEWSTAKGNEGISLAKDAKGNHITPLYDETDRNNAEKLNRLIADNFNGTLGAVPAKFAEVASVAKLVDMLDFSKVSFEKSIALSAKSTVVLQSKYPFKKIEEIANLSRGASPRPINNYITDDIKGVNWIKIGDVNAGSKYIERAAEKITVAGAALSRAVMPGDFIISNSMSFGRPYILKISGCVHDGWLILSNISKTIDKDYLYCALSMDLVQQQFEQAAAGTVVRNLNIERVSSVSLPVPPLNVQQQIVAECEAVDLAASAAKNELAIAEAEITTAIATPSKSSKLVRLGDICDMKAGKFVAASEINSIYAENLYACYGGNGLRGYTTTMTHEGTYPLIGRQGALCGNVHLVSGQFHATEHAVVVGAGAAVESLWLYYKLIALNLNQYATGMAQPGLSVEQLKTVTFELPPLASQRAALVKIKNLEKTIANAQATIDAAPAKKQAVMQRYL